MALSEVKPCPFCGEPPTSYPSGDGSGTMIECMNRDCVGPHVSYYGKGVAERVWNTRSEPDERVKGLVEAAIAVSEDASPNSDGALLAHDAVVDGSLILGLREALSSFQDKPSE